MKMRRMMQSRMRARTTGKCFVMAVAFMFTALVGMVGTGHAVVLGLPDINYDSSHGPGNNTFTAQGVHYNAGTGLLGVSAVALDITFDGVTSVALTAGTVDYQVKLVSASSSGGIVTGNFGTDGVVGDDLIVTDTTGTLLTGDFVSYTLKGIIGTNQGLGDAIFLVTGGSLAPFYAGVNGGMVHTEFNVSPNFLSTSFASDLDGHIKGDIAPTPEPGTLLLVGMGLVGLGYLGRRKNA